MVIVAGSIQVDPFAREAYLAECVQVIRLARISPGCLDFAISPDLVDDTRVNVYERWETQEDLDAYRGYGPTGRHETPLIGADIMEFRGSFA